MMHPPHQPIGKIRQDWWHKGYNAALANLTSQETVEKAAHVIYRFRWSDHSPEENEAVFGESREIAEAVLRAVQEPPQ
jgi:hypothetical protein